MLFIGCPLIAGNGGSGYSRYGIGDLSYFVSSRAAGMGGTAIGVLSGTTINRFNPAAWTQINRTRYSMSTLYEGFTTTDGSNSAYLSGMYFNGFMIAIPIAAKNGITVALGFNPYSRVNYNVITPSSFDTLKYDIQYLGDGGISLGHIGLSYRIGNEFHIGAMLNYYNGILNYSTKQIFSGSNYTDAEVTHTVHANGIGMTVGILYSGIKKLMNLSEAHSFNTGLVFSTSSLLKATEEKYYTYKFPTITSRDTGTAIDKDIRIPFSLGGGVSYSTERYLFAADIYYQNWGNFTIGGIKSSEIRDSYRLSIGGEMLPKRDPSVSYWQRVAYRLGFFYNSTYYRIKGEPINEFGITGGFGTPIFGDTRMNIGIEYSFRGTTNQQLQKDNIIRVSFTLSGGELWFERPEQE